MLSNVWVYTKYGYDYQLIERMNEWMNEWTNELTNEITLSVKVLTYITYFVSNNASVPTPVAKNNVLTGSYFTHRRQTAA